MDRSPSAEDITQGPLPEAIPPHASLDAASGALLLDIAERSIVEGLRNRRPTLPDVARLDADLRRAVGAFVTLQVRGELNGCIGSIETDQPLGVSVARHTWSAAFADPRLPSLRRDDYEHLDIEISILSALEPIPADSRADVLDTLRPGVDGLLLTAGARHAVFLPSVWEQISSAEMFVAHLLHKAGLVPTSWPRDLRAFVFTAHKIARRADHAV